jgi:hypothetical protein
MQGDTHIETEGYDIIHNTNSGHSLLDQDM